MPRVPSRFCLLFVASALLACARDRGSEPPKESAAREPAARSDEPRGPDAQSDTPVDAPQEAAASAASAARGAELYGRMCAVCHGAAGEGYRADQAPALAQPDFLASVSDAFLRFAISVGRQGTTMSAWHVDHGGPLSTEDVDAVIAHMRSWQKTAAAALDDGPPRGDAARGKALFKRSCQRCHGPKAPYVRILNRQLLAHASPGFLRHALRVGRPPTRMTSFADKLGEQGIEDVVSYLASLPAWLAAGELEGTASPPPIPLGPVPLHPKGPEPKGFRTFPEMTSIDVIGPAYRRKARMALLDARAPSDYAAGHIAGAVSVPFYDPSPYLDKLPKDAWLVCYCGCPHAESGALARQLLAAGYRKVTVLDEGLGAWTEQGYPMRSGLDP